LYDLQTNDLRIADRQTGKREEEGIRRNGWL